MLIVITNRPDFEKRWHLKSPIADVSVVYRQPADLDPGNVEIGTALVVVDVGPDGSTYPDTEHLASLKKVGPVLLDGGQFSVETELAALAAGASGCCGPLLTETELSTVVDVVLKGGIWVSRETLPILLGRLQGMATQNVANPDGGIRPQEFAARWLQLTPREREIALMVAKGESNKVIARNLALSDATIKAHLTSVFQKLHVSSRVQLALLLASHDRLTANSN